MSAGAREQAMRAQGVDADMEQILSSIRRIIAEDQAAMGMPLPEPRARKTTRQPSAQRGAAAAPHGVVRDDQGLNGVTSAAFDGVAPAQVSASAGPRLAPAPLPQPVRHAAVASSPKSDDPELRRATLDDSLQRLASERAESADSGLPPRRQPQRAQPPRPPVQMAPAPEIDYRPPEARARNDAAMAPDEDALVDQRLADAIRLAVNERIDEVAQAAMAAAQPAPAALAPRHAASGASGVSWDANPAQPAPNLNLAAHEPLGHNPYETEALQLRDLSGAAPAAMVGLAVARHGAAPPAAVAYARDMSGSLIAPVSAARISSAFDALTQRVAADRARTMEETVSDMLRPMLANWLDQHLPTIVERLVAEQIALLAQPPQD